MMWPRVAERVWGIAEPLTTQRGLEVVDVEVHPEHGRLVLRLYVDREGGVTLDELSGLSRELGDLIEAREVVDFPYTLEVSSPGINRPLKRREQFSRYVGKRVRVRTASAIDGRKNFLGMLLSVKDTSITLQLPEGEEVGIPLAAVARANYEHDFGLELRGGKTRKSQQKGSQQPGTVRRT